MYTHNMNTLPNDLLKLCFDYLYVQDILNTQYILKRPVYDYKTLKTRYDREELQEEIGAHSIHTLVDIYDQVVSIVVMRPHQHLYRVSTRFKDTHRSHQYVKQQFIKKHSIYIPTNSYNT